MEKQQFKAESQRLLDLMINSIYTQVVICKGWFLHPNTYDCGSFVVN